MPRILTIAVLAGLVAGLLVGGFHNLFTVPVIERAIAVEEAMAAAAQPQGMPMAEEPPLVSLGMQRVGMAVGTAIFGVILGLVFTGGYTLGRRAMPHWSPLALALVVGALGFWSLSLLPFIKYPLNPPGVGDPTTLTFRQGFQFLFLALSALGVVGLVLAIGKINQMAANRRTQFYALALAAYAFFVAVILLVLPSNPDPVSTPIDLLALFRALSMVGQFLLWALLSVGVVLALKWAKPPAAETAGPGAPQGRPATPPARR